MTNLIFKSNTFKLFSKFLEKYKNIDNLQPENYKKTEISFFKEFNNKNINNNNKLMINLIRTKKIKIKINLI